MRTKKYRVKVAWGQFKANLDTGDDYSIIDVWFDDHHHFDVYNVSEVKQHGIEKCAMWVAGLDNLSLVQEPFNPYGDGFTYWGHTEIKEK